MSNGESKLVEVADGVWVRQSEWVWTNSTVVRGDEGLIVVDPGIHGSELAELVADVDRLGIPVVAGFCTHPHWDHLLWHPGFGDKPRYATSACAEIATEARGLAQAAAAEEDPEIPVDVVAIVTPIPSDGSPIQGDIIEHRAHAIGHAAIFLSDRGVLIAGDMFSDILVPLLDPSQSDQISAYETAFDLLGDAVSQVDLMVPGHGSVARGREISERLAADRAYIAALRKGNEPDDARLEVEWMSGPHGSNLKQVEA